MTIEEIKQNLSIHTVLAHYNLNPDQNQRLICPFHDDKTPSLQTYPKTNTWTCFSSKCNAGSGDVIDLVMKLDGSSKHEAIEKCKSLINPCHGGQAPYKMEKPNLSRVATLTKYFETTLNGMKLSVPARAYAESRGSMWKDCRWDIAEQS